MKEGKKEGRKRGRDKRVEKRCKEQEEIYKIRGRYEIGRNKKKKEKGMEGKREGREEIG